MLNPILSQTVNRLVPGAAELDALRSTKQEIGCTMAAA
jgi:hypothetical protein